MMLRNNNGLHDKLIKFIYDCKSLTIIVPYIKLNALKLLLTENSSCNQIVIRWEPKDILAGVSDLEVYDFCKENGISLFWNKRIHLKVYLKNNSSLFLTTANISHRALGIDFNERSNHEVGTIISDISLEDKIYFQSIINESILVNDTIYKNLKSQLDEIEKVEDAPFEFELPSIEEEKHFLISSLPMSKNIETFMTFYFEPNDLNDDDLNCGIHDLVNYNIELGLSKNELRSRLKYSFENHPFIRELLNAVDEKKVVGMYFGEAKAWIQENCTNVPTPRRYELTGNYQIVLEWIATLINDKYTVDRPRHSERIINNKYLF